MIRLTNVVYTILIVLFVSCSPKEEKKTKEKLTVVTTTTMITDLLREIGGDKINLKGLMGAGVDPHLYKASEGDLNALYSANIIFYNGLHLEGKLSDVFEVFAKQGKAIALAEVLDKKQLINSADFASSYDPHVWFSIPFFKEMATEASKALVRLDPKNAEFYQENTASYLKKLTVLEKELHQKVAALPKEKRILVTAHDAFSYFGRNFDFEVVGLQGLSTVTEAGVKDVQDLSSYIITHQVKAVFVETSVPVKTIEALKEATKAKGHEISIGGSLYSDALGSPGTLEGTYLGMYTHNVTTIINALK